MPKQLFYWKTLALNMLFAFQGLFIISTAVDFFLTVLSNSARSQVLTELSPLASMIIILPWIAGIFILALMLIIFIANTSNKPWIPGVDIEYSGMLLLYLALFFIAIFNPLVIWPVVVNYLAHIIWVCAIMYFRIAVNTA
jgi:hypothetical protein